MFTAAKWYFCFRNPSLRFRFKKSFDMKKGLSSGPATSPGNMCNTALNKCDFHITLCLQGELPKGQVGGYVYNPNMGKNILKLIMI